jgi:hypothetical protein
MFDTHLREHGVDYRQHQQLAFFFARKSLQAAYMAFVHGLFPSLFVTSASDIHKKILPKYMEMLEEYQKVHNK